MQVPCASQQPAGHITASHFAFGAPQATSSHSDAITTARTVERIIWPI
jgi:hypothetical protein